ncbi:murein hydrolase activator EnvC family protein [Rhodococcus xishaensis]|uniref:M23 family metallopeptidase n=1 Tax=Rhodococcus xishaensis TaxID=2487364 RepID=A0A438B086_9NOCA|nr:M23 family metallopeptidase [Rhodococcus xishaensis]RVW04297.1 M23 family metallopeptidase [Rhodococcus xishaensis]
MGTGSRIIARIGVVLATVVVSAPPATAAPPRTPWPPPVTALAHDGVRATYDWPLRPRPRVVRSFDKPARNWLPGHRGVDLAATPGQPVLAAGAGTVVFAGAVAGRPVVSVDHPGGLRTTYEPVEPSVTAGRRVGRGALLGTVIVGHPKCAATACLHWGLRRDRDYLDPLPLVRAVPIRLLPTGTGQARG